MNDAEIFFIKTKLTVKASMYVRQGAFVRSVAISAATVLSPYRSNALEYSLNILFVSKDALSVSLFIYCLLSVITYATLYVHI